LVRNKAPQATEIITVTLPRLRRARCSYFAPSGRPYRLIFMLTLVIPRVVYPPCPAVRPSCTSGPLSPSVRIVDF
jgi:hypothetical protein